MVCNEETGRNPILPDTISIQSNSWVGGHTQSDIGNIPYNSTDEVPFCTLQSTEVVDNQNRQAKTFSIVPAS